MKKQALRLVRAITTTRFSAVARHSYRRRLLSLPRQRLAFSLDLNGLMGNAEGVRIKGSPGSLVAFHFVCASA